MVRLVFDNHQRLGVTVLWQRESNSCVSILTDAIVTGKAATG